MNRLDKITNLMHVPQKIRNIALVAHIDHGKTTLSDSLLVSAGLLAPSTAGEARALDYLPEEQRRGITMKTANISLIVQRNNQDYLVNLIDSPGHVDFSGKVARALRIADGAIVVIDAVEQIMAQTETVIRQCITEGVKPVLFINKIDRLINEIKLSPKKIAERIEVLYTAFNSLVENFSSNQKVPKWKCTTKDGSVVFGSALHKWALSVPIARKKNINFRQIVDYYKNNNLQELAELLPIAEPVLNMIINHLPNPATAQNYRMQRIWNGNLTSKIGQAMKNCQAENSPLVLCTTKTIIDQHAGPLVIGRIFSGTLSSKQDLKLLNAQSLVQAKVIFLLMGADKKRINDVPAGNIVAFSGAGTVHPGETIVDSSASSIVPFEKIQYLAVPVVTIAVEPKMLRDLPKLKHELERYDLEDPNLIVTIDDRSGEILLMGLGELHLETIIEEVSKQVECKASDPIVIIVERIEKASKILHKKQYETSVSLKVEPSILQNQSQEPVNETKSFTIKLAQYNNKISIDADLAAVLPAETIDNILLGAKEALQSGPVTNNPVFGVKVLIKDFQTETKEKFEHTVPLLRNAVWEALEAAGVSTQEPIYKIQIATPAKYLGKVSSIINKRWGIVKDIRTEQDLIVISGLLPVVESFKIDQSLRSETEGRAFWQMSFESYQDIPKNLLQKYQ